MKKLLGNKKLLLPLILVVLVVGVVLLQVLMPGMLPFSIQFSTGKAAAEPALTKESKEPEIDKEALKAVLAEKTFVTGQGVMYEAGARVINLADPSTRRYLRIAIYLEFVPKDPNFYGLKGEERKKAQEEFVTKELTPVKPVIEDTITSLLTSKAAGDVFTVGGKNKLKEEIKNTLNALMPATKVANVYFTEFLIQ